MIASVAPKRLAVRAASMRGVAAAVDHDAPAEQRLVLAFHRAQQRDGVEHLRGGTGGNKGALADMGADGEECRVEASDLHAFEMRSTLVLSFSATPRSRIRLISASSTSRGSRYFGMPKRIMPPANGPAS